MTWIKVKAFVQKNWYWLIAIPLLILAIAFFSGNEGTIYRAYKRIRDKMAKVDEERDKKLQDLEEEKKIQEEMLEERRKVHLKVLEAKYAKEMEELKKEDEKRYEELVKDPDRLRAALSKHISSG